ncbi:hypothetical protein BS47DRAFT_1453497 [Hydnum rufescens UP504]|uniref:Uncharacterized protein n=1 Tax=Hydnum rufescens UP504 TaxID=1448309 RepID=A0A9P6DEN1_9AGAM|nr:hypothetical protein BS47DRAFT_1453497 [Hydnum rufescens UP504]
MASRSGDDMRKTILIFHEFRVTATPALSKHIYPKIHYPEVYVLEGGYFSVLQLSP